MQFLSGPYDIEKPTSNSNQGKIFLVNNLFKNNTVGYNKTTG